MTVRLLTLASLAWASTAMAQDWEAPVAPGIEDQAVAIENEGEYYATLVGTGQFLRGANNWGTRASLTLPGAAKAPYKVVLYQGLEEGNNPDEEAWSVSFPAIGCGAGYAGDFLFVHHFPNDVYCNSADNGSNLSGERGNLNFRFTPNDDGTNTYRIEVYEHLDEGKYLGFDGSDKGGDGPIVKMVDDNEKSYVDWAFIPADVYEATDFDAMAEAFKVYEAKLVLFDVLNEAYDREVELDDIVEIYNNDASTVADIEAATKVLRDRIIKSLENEEEADVTSLYIKNYDCENIEGWTGDFRVEDYGGHYETNPETGAHFSNHLIELCHWSPTWEDRLDGTKTYWLKQTINVPAGKYRLEVNVLAAYMFGEADEEMVGVRLFADAGPGLYVESSEISTSRNYPDLVSVEFECTSTVTFGIKVENTNGNWIAVDNWKLIQLERYGEANALQLDLDSRVKAFEDYLEVEDEDEGLYVYNFSKATRAAVTALVEKCKANTDKSEAALQALIDEADAMLADLKVEIDAYKQLITLYNKVMEDIGPDGPYNEYGSLSETLGQLADDITDQFEGEDAWTWDTAKIMELVNGYDQLIEDGVRKFIAEEAVPGTDISVLIKNRDMDEGEHWVNTWGNPQIPGWNPESNSPWGYDKSAGEFWNRDFDFYQDIEGLPAGKYTVSFQGFYRWGNPGEVVDGYDPDMVDDPRIVAVLYGNDVETKFKDIVAGRVPTSEGGRGVDAGVDEDGEECMMPNSMEDAQYYFTNFPEKYHTEATAIVGEDGHLRIGIKAYDPNQKGNRWVIFDTFRLRYDGNEANMYFDEMQKQMNELMAKCASRLEYRSLPQDICDEVDAMAKQCKEMMNSAATTTEQCTEFIKQIKAVSLKLDDIATTIAGLLVDYNYYSDADYDGEFDINAQSEEFLAIYNIAEQVGENQGEHTSCLWQTTAELEGMRLSMNQAFVKSYFDAAPENTSAAKPHDMTPVIRYASLGDEDVSDDSDDKMKFWNGHVGGHVCGMVEVWNNNFDFNQTIMGLPEGYYQLTVDGCYRYGDVTDAVEAYEAGTEDLAAELYAAQGETIWAKPLMSVCTGATDIDDVDVSLYEDEVDGNGNPVINIREIEGNAGTYYLPYTQTTAFTFLDGGHFHGNELFFHSDGGNVTIGVKKTRLKSGDSSVYDNFQLFYVGQEAPAGYQDGVATGVNTVASARGAKMGYYTIGGLQLSRPQKGVNIVVMTMPDGTQKTVKVVVK